MHEFFIVLEYSSGLILPGKESLYNTAFPLKKDMRILNGRRYSLAVVHVTTGT